MVGEVSLMTTRRLAALFILVLGAASCRGNPLHCEGHPFDDCDLEWDAAGPVKCTSNAECAAPTAVCDVAGTETCVECVAPDETAACIGAEPVCGDDHACRGCVAHAECASAACLSDGTCALSTSVAYVDPSGTDNTMCTQAMPCTSVAKALATNRPFVKFTGTTDEAVTISNGRKVTFLADANATLTRTVGNGAIVTVRDDASELTVFDLSISNAPNNPSGVGLVIPAAAGAPKVRLTRTKVANNPGGGVSASGGTFTISQSTISGNSGGGISASGGTLTIAQSTVSGNAGGGISISGSSFDITNSFITSNGSGTSIFGGVKIDAIPAAGSGRLDFNTIAANQAPATVNTGITCGTVLTSLTFANNIVFANLVSGGGKQLGGSPNCTATFSDIGPDPTPGNGNINADPMFVDVVQGNFHLKPQSPARDAADPAASLNVDFDGDARPQGDRRDMGADEVR
ncbi:MAG: right-handed parallel beta-helix repeat-containing protein [Deltaproteobacteria bacterium]|nr:right-handed parallel beta-helix repeat-containing protein [Deltaproteobacteria bacterium]